MHFLGGNGILASIGGTFLENNGELNMANISYLFSIGTAIIYSTFLIKKMIYYKNKKGE